MEEAQPVDKTPIFFRVHQRKALEVIVYLAELKPGISPIELAKILFLSEQESLLDWGRPIIGDCYILQGKVPVPMFIRDLIQGNHLFTKVTSDVSSAFVLKFENTVPKIYAKRKHNPEVFSISDKETLNGFVIKNSKEIQNLLDVNETLIMNVDHAPISYEDFIPDTFESKEGFVAQLREFMYFGMFGDC